MKKFKADYRKGLEKYVTASTEAQKQKTLKMLRSLKGNEVNFVFGK